MAVSTEAPRDQGARMQRHFRRTETRVVRPFFNLKNALDEAAILLGESDPIQDTFVDIDTHETRISTLGFVVPPLAGDAVRKLEVPNDSLCLAVFGEEGVRNKRQILHVQSIDRFVDARESIRITEIPLQDFVLGERSRIALAVVLSDAQPPVPGAAHRKGSWFARKEFSFGYSRSQSVFKINYVDEEFFFANGLPRDTPYWFSFEPESLNDPVEFAEDLVHIHIAKQLADAMSRNPSSNTVKSVMANIVTDVITAVLVAGLDVVREDPADGSILDSVLSFIEGAVRVEANDLLRGFRNNPQTIRPWVQSALDTNRAFIASLRNG